MVNTQNYRTKTVIEEHKNVTVDGCWPIALDIGYSSVKGFSPNSIFAFPSYAKNLGRNPSFYGEPDDDEILYRDADTKEIWRVGRSAQKMISDRDTSDSQMELFGRDRYFSQMFMIILRTGLALGLMDNSIEKYNNKPIYIQTGLPPAYLTEDAEYMTEAIAGEHHFSVKVGKQRSFTKFDINIPKSNVSVMSQPEGTLMSLVMDDNANTIPGSKKYFQSNIIIFDAGFGTLDLFDIKNRSIQTKETFSEFGMKEVLRRTGEKIRQRTKMNILPSAMQNSLETGHILVMKRSSGPTVSSRKEPFADLLEESSNEVCKAAVEKIINIYSGLFQYDYLILTGGTSSAWSEQIKQYFSEVSGLTVLPGNENSPTVDLIFCNVRGYYMMLINALRRKQASKNK